MKAGRTSTAVMAARRSGKQSLDFLPTPPWATRAFLQTILTPMLEESGVGREPTIWGPCCGAGHMAIPLDQAFDHVFASDVADWGHGSRRDLDFTFATAGDAPWPVDWVITNPPFVLAERILDRALSIARQGVALLLRLQWLEGEERFRLIFGTDRRPLLVCPFVERVPMIEGVWDPEASSATAYAWFVWRTDLATPPAASRVKHIPPGMARRMTIASDEALAARGESLRRRQAARATAP
jgi:hypothetical protein